MLYCWGGEIGRRIWGQEFGENWIGCGEGCRVGIGCGLVERYVEKGREKGGIGRGGGVEIGREREGIVRLIIKEIL